jgi:hypothetical protein
MRSLYADRDIRWDAPVQVEAMNPHADGCIHRLVRRK